MAIPPGVTGEFPSASDLAPAARKRSGFAICGPDGLAKARHGQHVSDAGRVQVKATLTSRVRGTGARWESLREEEEGPCHSPSAPTASLIRATAPSHRFVRVEITAPEAPRRADRIPVNLAFVIDRSGSMAGDKIRKAREAAIQGIRALRAEDRFAVVAYDDHVDVVVPSSLATPEARAEAEERIAGIGDRGSTDLHAGWLAGCEEVGRALRDDAVGRCLLLTDGLANQGITSPDEIASRVAALRQRRISTSALGVGSDFDEHLLAQVAEAGGGNFHFIEGASQIPEFMGAEVGEALAITARDVVLVVEAGEGALVESLNDFPCTREGDAWRIELGSMFGGQMLDPVLRLTLPGGTRGRRLATFTCVSRIARAPSVRRAAPSRSRGKDTPRTTPRSATGSWIAASPSSTPRGPAARRSRTTGPATSRPRAAC